MTGRGGAVGGQEHTEPTDKVGGNNSFIATQHDDGVRHDGARRGVAAHKRDTRSGNIRGAGGRTVQCR